ncbi:MAG: hypothetical protein JWO06_1135 [Bacteroidota bacterium]|nr:hypothetical protein [Bacteroidota bacterium]
MPCRDTFSFIQLHSSYDIGVILPSWMPVIDKNYVAILEGKVTYNLVNGTDGPHISEEDLPFYHYSHDMDFNIVPDKTDDNRFTNLLPYLVYKKEKGNDTVMHSTIGCEWECGMATNNRINPLQADNDAGRSGGFFSAGHEMGDLIWNWPCPGDWAHVEGNYSWDRGHPPSEAEIHPPRFTAFKRVLLDRIIIGDSSVKFATRVDIFASGDGGALMNNRYNSPAFVKRVNMSSKDYEFTVKLDVPRPSAKAHMRFAMIKHKGDDFSTSEIIEPNEDSGTVNIIIPWKTKNANDLEIYARTIYLYWDEGSGASAAYPVDIYKVKLNKIHFRHLDEILSKAEVRLFVNVGSEWIFMNDFFAKKGKVLSKGLGKTFKHTWNLNNEFTVYVPRGKSFRVYMNGWEADGIDLLFGNLLDPGSLCNRKTKRFFKNSIFSFGKMWMKGCMDDSYGETSKLHGYDNLGKTDHITNSPQSGMNDDPCPGSKYPLKDRVFLTYTIEKVN